MHQILRSITIRLVISIYKLSDGSRAGEDDRGELFHSLLHQRRAIRHSWDQVRLGRNGRVGRAGFRAVFARVRMPWNRLSSQEGGNAEVVALTAPRSSRPWPAG